MQEVNKAQNTRSHLKSQNRRAKLTPLEELQEEHAALNAHYRRLARELASLQQDYSRIIEQRNSLFGQLEQFTSFRSQVRSLLLGAYRKLLSRIERLNQPPRLKREVIMASYDGDAEPAELLLAAAGYDKKALRESRVLSGRLRRICYRLLKFMLKAMGKILRRAFRLLKRLKRMR